MFPLAFYALFFSALFAVRSNNRQRAISISNLGTMNIFFTKDEILTLSFGRTSNLVATSLFNSYISNSTLAQVIITNYSSNYDIGGVQYY